MYAPERSPHVLQEKYDFYYHQYVTGLRVPSSEEERVLINYSVVGFEDALLRLQLGFQFRYFVRSREVIWCRLLPRFEILLLVAIRFSRVSSSDFASPIDPSVGRKLQNSSLKKLL